MTGTLGSGAIANFIGYTTNPSTDIFVQFEGRASTDGYVKANKDRVKLNVERNMASSFFGDATPADVAKGKTFTSQHGIKLVGTIADGTEVEY